MRFLLVLVVVVAGVMVGVTWPGWWAVALGATGSVCYNIGRWGSDDI